MCLESRHLRTPQEVHEVQSTDTDVHQQVALALTNKVPTSIISRDATGILFVGVFGLFWTLGLTYFHRPKILYKKSAQSSVRGRNGLGRHQLQIWRSCIYARETTETQRAPVVFRLCQTRPRQQSPLHSQNRVAAQDSK